jgi:hypothetical protein
MSSKPILIALKWKTSAPGRQVSSTLHALKIWKISAKFHKHKLLMAWSLVLMSREFTLQPLQDSARPPLHKISYPQQQLCLHCLRRSYSTAISKLLVSLPEGMMQAWLQISRAAIAL